MPAPLSNYDPKVSPRRGLDWIGVSFALVFPTIVTWAYFVSAADFSAVVQQTTYALAKGLQFAFPVLWVWSVLKQPVSLPRPRWTGVPLGLLFGLSVTFASWVLFEYGLRGSPVIDASMEPMRAKIAGLGLNSVWRYAALAVFYSLIHSLLEEYYWRWFVFGQLRSLVPPGAAIAVSAVGFAAHHVLVLATYFGWWSWLTVLLSTAVALGGAFWAWLYERSDNLYGPWLSHLVIDAGIFFVGYQLVGESWVAHLADSMR